MLRLQHTTGRTPTRSPLLAIPQEINTEHLLPYLQPRTVWNLSIVCLGLRIHVATADQYWKRVPTKLPSRHVHKVPFYNWILKESSHASVALAWRQLKRCLSTLQRSSLLPPVTYHSLHSIERAMKTHFPLDIVFSLTCFHNGQSTARNRGSQLTDGFFMLPCWEMPLIQHTQQERGFPPQNFVPMFIDSSHQQIIGANATNGKIILWSPLNWVQWGESWSTYLQPE